MVARSTSISEFNKVTLITSRVVLQLQGEQVYDVGPLAVPDLRSTATPDRLTRYAAARLFVERAQTARANFVVTAKNASAVAEICARVEGLPLAIELAAVRIRVLSPEAILARLDPLLPLLTEGARDRPARHQTLRRAIDWSYDLLMAKEQALFRHLAVFRGSFALAAAEASGVTSDGSPASVLDGVTALVDKSLLRRDDEARDEPRFVMHELIREYGWEKLIEAREAEALRQWHARYYLALAEDAESHLHSPQQRVYSERLLRDLDNVRAALGWFLHQGETEAGLRLTLAVEMAWWSEGFLAETRTWFRQFLTLPGPANRTALRARALVTAGDGAYVQGDAREGRALGGEALIIAREVGDRRTLAFVLRKLSQYCEPHERRKLAEESLNLYRDLGDQIGMSHALAELADSASAQGETGRARVYAEESLAIVRAEGRRWGIADRLELLGDVVSWENPAEARGYLMESLAIYRELGDAAGEVSDHVLLGRLDCLAGNFAAARDCFQASLLVAKAWTWTERITEGLDGLAWVAAGLGQPARALRLASASVRARDAAAQPASPREQSALELALEPVRQSLGAAATAATWAEGQAMTLDEAVAYALEEGREA